MKTRGRRGRSRVALFTAFCFMAQGFTPLLAQAPAAGAAKAPAAAAAGPKKAGASAQAPVDKGWPRSYALPSGGGVLLYQPQVASWENQKRIVAYSAVSYQPTGAPKPHLGSVKVEADTKVALDERLVNFAPLQITEANFPTLGKEKTREIVAEIDKAIPDTERVIALDRVLAGLDKSQILPKNLDGVKSDPPTIFFSKKPAVLVNFDGEPIWSPIRDNDLKFALNTNWDVFQHTPTSGWSNTSGTARSTTDQLTRDSSARTSGSQRTQDYSSYRSGGSSARASSYRSSGSSRGGGSRGGGGGRRR